jgi:hypothetical protein
VVSRVATRFAVAVALIAVLAGCGTPPGIDHQEQVAFARACVSLVERGLSDDRPPRVAVLDDTELDLDKPAEFYSALDRIRGPQTFDLHDPSHAADTARQPLDKCDAKRKPLSSLLSTTTTTTTTTSTTVPGS